ncbi:MAG: DUF2520 domain-containing protein [Bacteroidales bacterium]|nr:DUF2520 domain-containing protein [Bacteroidales bacterium]
MNLSIVGAGNVATHIAQAAAANGHRIDAVYSRTAAHAQRLADLVGARYTTDLCGLCRTSDIYIISVSDNAISGIASQLADTEVIVAHTSGATDIDALAPCQRRGVIYPCQTLTRTAPIDFKGVPLLIEASDEETRTILMEFAKSLSNFVSQSDSVQRAQMHVAAVVASNFTNRLLTLAHDYLKRHNVPFEMLRPLVEQTVSKAFTMNPYDAQTGPARRGDTATIERHLQLIDDERLRTIYEMLSNDIMQLYN